MKHFLVVHEVGHPIYYDHPEGSLLCPTFSATQQLLMENFRQMAKYFKVGKTTLAFHHDGCLYYCAASDEEENYSVLKRQLHLLRDFIAFFVADSLSSGYTRVVPSLTPALRPVIQTISHLARTRQSFIVQGIETLEVNRELRDRCEEFLRAAWQRAPEQALHCLLFVNTKLVTLHSRPGAFTLSSADLFLLSVYLEAIVGAHLQGAAVPARSTEPSSPVESSNPEGEAYIPGVGSVDDVPLHPVNGDGKPLDDNVGGQSDPGSSHPRLVPATPERGPAIPHRGSAPAAIGSLSPSEAPGEADSLRPALPRAKLCYLRASAAAPHELHPFTVYVDEVYPKIYTVVVLDCRPEQLDEEKKRQLAAAHAQFREGMVQLRDFFVIKEKTHFSIVHYVKIAPGLVHFILVERTNSKYPNRVICPAISRLSSHDNRRLDDLPDSQSLRNMKRLLWDSVLSAHEMQEAGYQETLRDLNGLQCHHKVWLEDEEANEQPVDPTHSQTLATCPYAFRDRLHSRRLRCYEFYALYLGAMSAQSVAMGSRKLICHLLDGQGKRKD